MRLQLVAGPVRDGQRLRRQWERWTTELAPATPGWVGASGGCTPDGRGVVVNLSSPPAHEPGPAGSGETAWWSATGACLGHADVRETTEVTLHAPRDHSDAGFVQVMLATVASRAAFEATEDEIAEAFVAFRPDFLAGYRAWFPDGTMAAVDYFRSEAEARASEARPMPADLETGFGRWIALVGGAEWFDLPDPWHSVPR